MLRHHDEVVRRLKGRLTLKATSVSVRIVLEIEYRLAKGQVGGLTTYRRGTRLRRTNTAIRGGGAMSRAISSLATLAILAGCASAPTAPTASTPPRDTHERLHGALWYQTTPEFWISSKTAFQDAKRQLDLALADPTWTAAKEQEGMAVDKFPGAVILDIDETVLDNSPFQARLAADRIDYAQPLFDCWVAKKIAAAMPGSKDFLSYAITRGVKVIYITNRTSAQESDTIKNLISSGLPVQQGGDSVLSKGEKPAWTSEKKTRREEVANAYRILLLIGDDLGDFVAGSKAKPSDRRALAQAAEAYWGTKWILLPNPLYGSWEQSLYDFNFNLPDSEILKTKFSQLQPFDNSQCPKAP